MVGLLVNFFSHNKDLAAIADSFVFFFSFDAKVRAEKNLLGKIGNMLRNIIICYLWQKKIVFSLAVEKAADKS